MKEIRILIADSNYGDRQLIKEIIGQFDIPTRLMSATSGRATLRQLELPEPTRLPELLVLEYEIGDLPGEEILQKLSKMPTMQSVLKVVWTSLSLPLVCEQSRRWGVHLCLPKNIQPSSLKKALRALLFNSFLKPASI